MTNARPDARRHAANPSNTRPTGRMNLPALRRIRCAPLQHARTPKGLPPYQGSSPAVLRLAPGTIRPHLWGCGRILGVRPRITVPGGRMFRAPIGEIILASVSALVLAGGAHGEPPSAADQDEDALRRELHDRVASADASEPNVMRIQELLADLGYKPGRPDGKLGPSTWSALSQWKKDTRDPASISWASPKKSASRRDDPSWEIGFPPKGCYWKCTRSRGCVQQHNEPAKLPDGMVVGQLMGEGSASVSDSGEVVYSPGTTIRMSPTLPAEQDGWVRSCD